MDFIFDKDGITYNENKISYDTFETDEANNELIKILINCIKNEENLHFSCTDDCTPFGRLIKETLENEFSSIVADEI